MKITKNSGIYYIIDKKYNKLYVGSSKNINRRLKEHIRSLENKTHWNKRLQEDYDLGLEFEADILEECEETKLLIREQYYIDTFRPQYNILQIASNGTIGYEHSKDCKALMSKIKKEQFKNGLQVWNKGISPDREVKEKISKSLKGRYVGEKHPFFGKTHTEEAKKLMVEASIRRTGTHHSPHKGKLFRLSLEKEVIEVYNATWIAAEQMLLEKRAKGSIHTTKVKIAESSKKNTTAYGFRWLFENDLDQVKVDELLESLARKGEVNQQPRQEYTLVRFRDYLSGTDHLITGSSMGLELM